MKVAVAAATGLTVYLVGRWGRLGDWFAFGWLQYLGRISYSLFLIHYPVSWAVLYFGCNWTGDHEMSAVIWLFVALTTSILVAHLLYTFVEAPSLWLCSWIKKVSIGPAAKPRWASRRESAALEPTVAASYEGRLGVGAWE